MTINKLLLYVQTFLVLPVLLIIICFFDFTNKDFALLLISGVAYSSVAISEFLKITNFLEITNRRWYMTEHLELDEKIKQAKSLVSFVSNTVYIQVLSIALAVITCVFVPSANEYSGLSTLGITLYIIYLIVIQLIAIKLYKVIESKV